MRDRLSFTRFLGRGVEDGTTLWLFREKLARAGLIATPFDRFDQHLNAKGYIARGGQLGQEAREERFSGTRTK